jgi:hypothetical protein
MTDAVRVLFPSADHIESDPVFFGRKKALNMSILLMLSPTDWVRVSLFPDSGKRLSLCFRSGRKGTLGIINVQLLVKRVIDSFQPQLGKTELTLTVSGCL